MMATPRTRSPETPEIRPSLALVARRSSLCYWLLGLLLALGAFAPSRARGTPTESARPGRTRVIFVVRHAEKAAEPAEDPPLTAAGVERSRELLRTLRPMGVEAAYGTRTERSRETLQPFADSLGLTPHLLEPDDPFGAVKSVLADPAPVVLMAGHGDTVPHILEGLGISPLPDLDGIFYDDLFVVTRWDDGRASLTHLKYGARAR